MSILSLVLSPVSALALSDAQLNIFGQGIYYFDAQASDCSSSPAAPGTGAPTAASFPNLDPGAMAAAINSWIIQANPNSRLANLGSTIVADAQNSNINPFLIVAIAREESTLADPGNANVIGGGNSFGRTATDSQPHFEGSHQWYKWSSVQASVDYTAPENQNASGGGDIASYIRAQYGGQLDANNLLAMFLDYAPAGDGNDPVAYSNNVSSWISALVSLTTGQAAPASGPTSSCVSNAGCVGSGAPGNAAILCEAEKYAGIYYSLGGGHQSYSTFRQNCPTAALASAAANSTAASPGPCATDCSGLISVAVDGAFNQNYVWTVSDSNGQMLGDGAQYWQSVPINKVQAGDIVTTIIPDGHVEIVDHIQGSTIYTFGSHQTGKQTGPINTPASYWVTGAWRWAGPGGTGQ